VYVRPICGVCGDVSFSVINDGGSYSGSGTEVCHVMNKAADFTITKPANCTVSCSRVDNGNNIANNVCSNNVASYTEQWKSFSVVVTCGSTCTKTYDFTVKQAQQTCP
jgi:hypothetical protein